MGQRESQETGEPNSAIHSPSAFDIPIKEPHQGINYTQSRRELRRQFFHIRGRAETAPCPALPPLTLVENRGVTWGQSRWPALPFSLDPEGTPEQGKKWLRLNTLKPEYFEFG